MFRMLLRSRRYAGQFFKRRSWDLSTPPKVPNPYGAGYKISGPRRGVQTDGVLVQRWVDSAGPGLRPGRCFLRFLGDFQAKMAYHTTYRTSLESSH